MHEIYGEEYRQKVRERLAEKGVHMPDPDEVLPLGLREEL